MTYIKLKNNLTSQIDLLIDFLPYCETSEQKFKILEQLQELKYKIQRIDRMIYKYSDVTQHTEVWNSEMNFNKHQLKIA